MTKTKTIGSLIILTAFLFTPAASQNLSKYEKLKDPQINKMPAKLKMLVVEAKGDPNIVGGEAFSLLFKTYFSLKGVKMATPRARWSNIVTDPKNEWVGLYALPLPDNITELPAGVTGVRIEDWDYGEVAEILHIGPYSEETPTIERLHLFIEEQGYRIAGPHEEEYLKGPGMGPVDPAEYQTIIRYPVKKK